jgi:DNA end-binding protein Ku
MPRPIWNGTISFGLLNVPVQLFSGERSVDLHFRLLDSRDKQPIRYERVNAETGEEVPWKDIVKAFEYAKGSYVVIEEEEIRKAAPEATEMVEIEAFVDAASINPMYFEKPYYLVPGKKAEKGYVLLRQTLKKTGKVGVAKVVIRTRQYLSIVQPLDDALVLNLLRFPQEIVEPDEFKLPSDKAVKVSAKEVAMATQLVESMATKWNPADYTDDFRSTLRKIIDTHVAKEQGKPAKASKTKTPAGATTNVVDFMSLLKKSLDEKKRPSAKSSESDKKPRAAVSKRSATRRRHAR